MTTISDAAEGLLTGDDPGKTCQDCSFINPSEEEFCLACNSALGRIDRFADAGKTTGRYHELREACERVAMGTMGHEEFVHFLEDLSAKLAAKSRDILDTIEATNYWQDGADEIEMGTMGIRSYEDGLAEIWQYTQDNDPGHFEQGLVMVWEGYQRILEAMRINRESRQMLAMEWEGLQNPADMV